MNLRNALYKACNFGLILTGWAFLIASTPSPLTRDSPRPPIIDPAYNLKAFTITIPAGWKFQGTVLPGPACSDIPYPVFRAYSPDGLNEIRLQPTFNWTFHPNIADAGTQRMPGLWPPTDRRGIPQALRRDDRRKRHARGGTDADRALVSATRGWRRAEYEPDRPAHPRLGECLRRPRRNPQRNLRHRAASARLCGMPGERPAGPMAGGGCSAHVDVLRAPKGKLDALCGLVDAHDLVRTPHEDAWLQRVQQTLMQRAREDQARPDPSGTGRQAMLKRQFDDSWPPRSATTRLSWPGRNRHFAVP